MNRRIFMLMAIGCIPAYQIIKHILPKKFSGEIGWYDGVRFEGYDTTGASVFTIEDIEKMMKVMKQNSKVAPVNENGELYLYYYHDPFTTEEKNFFENLTKNLTKECYE